MILCKIKHQERFMLNSSHLLWFGDIKVVSHQVLWTVKYLNHILVVPTVKTLPDFNVEYPESFVVL